MALTWNGPNGQPDTIDLHGVTTTISFDPTTGNPSHTTDTLGRVTTTGFDAAGNVNAFYDGQTSKTYSYDANNRLVSVTDADNNVTQFGYSQAGCSCSQQSLVTSIHTPDLPPNESWTLSYGPEGRLATLTDPEDHSESYTYEPTGELKSLTDRLGNPLTIGHDHLGRVQSIVDALGRAHQWSYPVPTSSQLSGAQMLTGSASTSLASSDLTQPLNSGDYQIGVRDFDAYNPIAGSTTVGTRGTGQITFYRDATLQLSYGRQFDQVPRLTRQDDRSGFSFTDNNVIDSSGPNGTWKSGKYTQAIIGWNGGLPDDLPKGLAAELSGRQEIASETYNGEYDLTNANGYADSTSISVNATYSPDTGGRRIGTALRFSGPASPTASYSYEPTSDRLMKVIDQDGEHDFTYDERGLVKTITIVGEGTYTFGYDAVGRNNSLTYPDGHERTQGYDPEGRLNSRCYTYGDAGTGPCYSATYDADGNPLTMTDPEGQDVFQYDNLNRVTSATRKVSGQPDVKESYGYNALGALITNAPETTGLSLSDQRPIIGGSGNAPSALMASINGATVTVDPAGRLTALQGSTLTVRPAEQSAHGHDREQHRHLFVRRVPTPNRSKHRQQHRALRLRRPPRGRRERHRAAGRQRKRPRLVLLRWRRFALAPQARQQPLLLRGRPCRERAPPS